MQIHTAVHWLPKRGNAAEEYEDAFWPPAGRAETTSFRCAVADGATEASFSRQWARSLAEAFCTGALSEGTFLEDLAALQADWQTAFGEKTSELAWYAEQKAQRGAFSSLLGLVVQHADGGAGYRWQALAVGDSNLFQVRAGAVVAAFPLQRAEQFDSSPFLVSSNSGTATPELLRHLALAAGELQPGDTFYLMTDALACWFAECWRRGEEPWELLDALPVDLDADDLEARGDAFAGLVAVLRDSGELHNDDVTLLRLRVDAALCAAPAAVVASAAAVAAAPLPWQRATAAPRSAGAAEPVQLDELEELTDEELDSWLASPAAPDTTAAADPGLDLDLDLDDGDDGDDGPAV